MKQIKFVFICKVLRIPCIRKSYKSWKVQIYKRNLKRNIQKWKNKMWIAFLKYSKMKLKMGIFQKPKEEVSEKEQPIQRIGIDKICQNKTLSHRRKRWWVIRVIRRLFLTWAMILNLFSRQPLSPFFGDDQMIKYV